MMDIKRSFWKVSAVIFLVVSVLTACRKEPQAPVYSYFVTKELKGSYTEDYITSLINVVSVTIPEAGNLRPFVNSDVKVYKIVYKTTINGQQVDASGLVCVPATPGEYPVLSFQNGTNTVNADAPSENPSDYSYQLIEILSSMGYIVVIADYPGFGESSQIPHPYLVGEPTVRSLIDMLFAVKELTGNELSGISLKNEYYLIGYSQGGWATLELLKAMELDYDSDFNLKGCVCGAGPYNIYLLLKGMVNATTYPMPVYLGYILNAYKAYDQFTNPVSDIFNEPYASRVSTLYTGVLSSGQINAQLTTSIPGLITPGFLSGFETSANYASVREALLRNSVSAWHSNVPLLLIHGGKDTYVDPISTENMYNSMIQAGTSTAVCTKVIVPDVDHSTGIAPCMIRGVLFLQNLKNGN
jgi:pimeloyl-ACP methyl ester carboxylesterase